MADDEEATDEQTTDEAEESTSDEAKDSTGDDAKSESGSDGGGDDSGGATSEEAAKDDDPDFGLKEDEPANDVQMKYLQPLADEQGEEVPDDMSEADAANKINEMQENAAS